MHMHTYIYNTYIYIYLYIYADIVCTNTRVFIAHVRISLIQPHVRKNEFKITGISDSLSGLFDIITVFLTFRFFTVYMCIVC